MNRPEAHAPIPCPWPADCHCDHSKCVAGWLDNPEDEDEYETVRPCPSCRPAAAQALASNKSLSFRSREAAAMERQRQQQELRNRTIR